MSRGRVAVAMSGGVDSSVVAALLVEQGYDVVGVTMRISKDDAEPEYVRAAVAVAESLGIAHHVFDLSDPFERLVISPFCEDYLRGRTPNPCIGCNAFVKFGELMSRSLALGAERLATGHYARVVHDEGAGRWKLLMGIDRGKDQSYTLYRLTQEQLSRAVFPLGEMTKDEVRLQAERHSVSAPSRPESQDICFLKGESYREYLCRRFSDVARAGPIVDRQGRQIGRHRGIAFYTIGQRQGLSVACGRPLYVVAIDVEGNRLIVGEEDEAQFGRLVMGDVNYGSLVDLPGGGMPLHAKIRSQGELAACIARPSTGGRVRLEFEQGQWGVSPGQAAVCYEGEAVAVGGTIEEAF